MQNSWKRCILLFLETNLPRKFYSAKDQQHNHLALTTLLLKRWLCHITDRSGLNKVHTQVKKRIKKRPKKQQPLHAWQFSHTPYNITAFPITVVSYSCFHLQVDLPKLLSGPFSRYLHLLSEDSFNLFSASYPLPRVSFQRTTFSLLLYCLPEAPPPYHDLHSLAVHTLLVEPARLVILLSSSWPLAQFIDLVMCWSCSFHAISWSGRFLLIHEIVIWTVVFYFVVVKVTWTIDFWLASSRLATTDWKVIKWVIHSHIK